MASASSFWRYLAYTIMLSILLEEADAGGLKVGFYKKTCPWAESVIKKTVASALVDDPTVAAPLLRLHFHDCFVRGCDGSVLLNSSEGNTAEKDAMPNLSLGGFDVIDSAKAAVESMCPGVVSCADIVAFAARDGIELTNGPSWEVETGRRDGLVSKASEAISNLPSSFASINELKGNFAEKGLNAKDLAILSGAHTIGNSHCSSFSKRLYNFTGKGDRDPSLDPVYARTLRTQCRRGDDGSVVEMDPGSAVAFDSSYYSRVAAGKGLFVSDAALLQDKVTRGVVQQYAKGGSSFFLDFGAAMVKMGRIGVLTGTQGEIRRNCALVNK